MANPFIHSELNVANLDRAKAFYSSMFDWKLKDEPMGPTGHYTTISVGEGTGGTGGGMIESPPGGPTSVWVPYVQVDDVNAATAKARSLGAKVMRDVTEIPDMGSFSLLTDPTGAMLGLWQNKMS